MTLTRVSVVLFADDNPDDRFLMSEAWREAGCSARLMAVEDGDEALAYLRGEGKYADRAQFPPPALAILDLKMPRLSGLDALAWIRRSEDWKKLPVLLLTASTEPADIDKSFELCVNAYLVKPSSLEELVELCKAIGSFWLQYNRFPAP